MISPAMLILHLVIAIAIILVRMIVLKRNASIGHVNDSGFWVATNMSGLTVTGGLKTYTLGSFISSVFIFLLALIGALVIPM